MNSLYPNIQSQALTSYNYQASSIIQNIELKHFNQSSKLVTTYTLTQHAPN